MAAGGLGVLIPSDKGLITGRMVEASDIGVITESCGMPIIGVVADRDMGTDAWEFPLGCAFSMCEKSNRPELGDMYIWLLGSCWRDRRLYFWSLCLVIVTVQPFCQPLVQP